MKYIQMQHPKNSNLMADEGTFSRLLKMGWIGQKKMNGFRLQCHVDANGIAAFTRKGTKHTRKLSEPIIASFMQLEPESGVSVFDAEWVQPLNQVFLFDILVHENQLLNRLSYKERYEILEGIFKVTPHMRILPILTSVSACLGHMRSDSPYVEGLVFKALDRKGWPDTAIVRCRK